ncbi:30S ribosomal protein S12 methylthiotransferase RimO [bacterium]|nr:30S ribosomal protein S12 methylthiotransferase RimO [bacterium]
MSENTPSSPRQCRKAAFITLGCSKNEVDSEVLAGLLKGRRLRIIDDPADADVVVVNTCGFIEDAKQESINTILEAVRLKEEDPGKKVVVWGCLSQRYREDLQREIPEVDAYFGIEAFQEMGRYLSGETIHWSPDAYVRRHRFGPAHTAYLKIADGCDHRCTFCAIPGIKGAFRSRTPESLVEESEALAAAGARELILIGQDTAAYGRDLPGGPTLSGLLNMLVRIDGIDWIRIMYLYPGSVSDDLLEIMAAEEKICAYADIPLQHIADRVLRRMGRRERRADITALLRKMRAVLPDIVIRTTCIVGFPGERASDFNELLAFVKDFRFNRLGAFVFSREEGTPAFSFEDQVPRRTALSRHRRLMSEQQRISESLNAEMAGSLQEVIVDGYDSSQQLYYGRTRGDAPEVDQTVWIDGAHTPGEIIRVKITGYSYYDMTGTAVKEDSVS